MLRFAGWKLGDMCMWTMRVKNMLVFMVILKLGLISGLPCQYCWPRDGQREIASCDKGPSKCVQMMGLAFSSNIREIRVYSCEVRILGVNLKGIMVRNRRGKECTCKSFILLKSVNFVKQIRKEECFLES